MKWNKWATLPVLVAAFGLTGCGDTKDRFGSDANFTIKGDLDDTTFFYNFDEGEMRIRYYADVDKIVGVVQSFNQLLCVAIVGTPDGADRFAIQGGALDSNLNGDFLDEAIVPVTRASSGVFESNADGLVIDMNVVLNGLPITFAERGDFIRTESLEPRC